MTKKNKPKSVFQKLSNTLELLSLAKLSLYHNPPIMQESKDVVDITWPNHISDRRNNENFFGRIDQYTFILESQAFSSLLFDGSILRASYRFESGLLTKHTFLWHPAPFPIRESDLEIAAPLQLTELYMTGNYWHQDLRLRSPLRFDFDYHNASLRHPASHLHFQTNDCRLSVDRPVCFERFVKFIFKNFYPTAYDQNDCLRELKESTFGGGVLDHIEAADAFVAWSDRVSNDIDT